MRLSQLIDRKTWLAPLAGYTDQAFRILCKRHGAEVLVSEMVSADGLIRDSVKTEALAEFEDRERPFAIQLFGSDPIVMAKAAEYCLRFQPDLIDLNMGCPVKKVIKRGAGSALMKEPSKAMAIVREVKQALDGALPLSVKFRSGWDAGSLNYLDFGLAMQDSGADILCLHPRTAKQMFSGQSNWEHIRQLVSAVDIPVIGNGDISSPESALRMYQDTGCVSIMIGRGALGYPWIFSQIKELQSSGFYHPLTFEQIKDTMLMHLELALRYRAERIVIKEMRSQLCHYVKGIVGGKEFRRRINVASSAEEIRGLIKSLLQILPE